MPHQKIKFAVVGCGYIGKRHLNILSQHPECELTAIIDKDSHRLSELQHLNIPSFQSVDDYLSSDTETDVVIVATPNGTHASLAVQIMNQQKHVLIEKPMALKKSDAEYIIQTAKQTNRKAMVVLQNRFSPVSAWLKQLIDSNLAGKIFFVEVNCFWNRDERYYKKDSWHGTSDMDGGTLFTQFSHFIDTLYWLFGDIKNIKSRFYNFSHQHLTDFEDTGTLHFEFERGGLGCVNFSTALWDKTMESNLTILAENGTVKVSGQYMDRIEYCHIKNYDLPETIEAVNPSVSNHYKLIDAVVKAIKEDVSTNAEEALHSVDIIERMYAAKI